MKRFSFSDRGDGANGSCRRAQLPSSKRSRFDRCEGRLLRFIPREQRQRTQQREKDQKRADYSALVYHRASPMKEPQVKRCGQVLTGVGPDRQNLPSAGQVFPPAVLEPFFDR